MTMEDELGQCVIPLHDEEKRLDFTAIASRDRRIAGLVKVLSQQSSSKFKSLEEVGRII